MKYTLQRLLNLAHQIAHDLSNRGKHIAAFQNAVWENDVELSGEPAEDIFSDLWDLALVLDFFEEDSKKLAGDEYLYGEQRLLEHIKTFEKAMVRRGVTIPSEETEVL